MDMTFCPNGTVLLVWVGVAAVVVVVIVVVVLMYLGLHDVPNLVHVKAVQTALIACVKHCVHSSHLALPTQTVLWARCAQR